MAQLVPTPVTRPQVGRRLIATNAGGRGVEPVPHLFQRRGEVIHTSSAQPQARSRESPLDNGHGDKSLFNRGEPFGAGVASVVRQACELMLRRPAW